MRYLVLTSALAALLFGGPADARQSCGTAESFGQKIIKAGDPERRVIEQKPDRTVQLETRFGGAAGYRHDFYKPGRTVQIYVRAGVVTEICRVRD
ncbi:MAG: hypothetical protein RQ729_04220 [Wenzhouxiangellaceae bacterium]|nr:hypothetical protein [Wenzhouxiangellaceae bacterium]